MKKLEKYTSYKNSGVQWLEEIPVHWEILKAKYFHKNLKALNTKRICDNVLSLTLRGVVNNNRRPLKTSFRTSSFLFS